MINKPLKNKKIAILVESEYIPSEIKTYKRIFSEKGAQVDIMSRLWGQSHLKFVSDVDSPDKKIETMTVDKDFTKVNPGDYDAVISAAGYTSVRLRYFEAPEGKPIIPSLTSTAPAVEFFSKAMLNPNIIKGALCHGLWILTPRPDLLQGRRVTCHEVVLSDIANAGAIYVSEPSGVVVDGDLVTGRSGSSNEIVNLFIEKISEQIIKLSKKEELKTYEKQKQEERGLQAKVHIVLSSFGFWGEELVAPIEEFEKVGIKYDISTPYGHPPAVVDVSMDSTYIDPALNRPVTSPEMAKKVKDIVNSNLLKSVKNIEDVQVDDFDALLLVGGSGPILDINNCRPLHNLIEQCVKADKIVAAECYSIGCLAFTRDRSKSDLPSVIRGKKVTGHPIPHDYTTAYGYTGVQSTYPFIGPPIALEYMLRDAVGPEGEFIGNIDKPTSVIVDLPFITSRSVASSRECGQKLVEELKKQLGGKYGKDTGKKRLYATITGR